MSRRQVRKRPSWRMIWRRSRKTSILCASCARSTKTRRREDLRRYSIGRFCSYLTTISLLISQGSFSPGPNPTSRSTWPYQLRTFSFTQSQIRRRHAGRSLKSHQQYKLLRPLVPHQPRAKRLPVPRGQKAALRQPRQKTDFSSAFHQAKWKYQGRPDLMQLSEGPRSFKGPDSQRYTLKSYQSRAESNFRSYSEI